MSNITFAWMLQCVAPHLAIDIDAYRKYLDYYFDWTYRQKHACTHHAKTWTDTAKQAADWIPFVNPDLRPKPDPAHTHPEIERGWGLGPFVDDYASSTLYKWAQPVSRAPGNCVIEQPDGTLKLKGRVTHEYMHPVAEYRNVKRTVPEPSSAPPKMRLKFNRILENGRYTWVDKEDNTIKIPEWIIMGVDNFNFEREYYQRCLAAKNEDNGLAAKAKGKPAPPEEDWLKKVDDEVNFKLVKAHKNPFDYP
jgi:hypothetical protein